MTALLQVVVQAPEIPLPPSFPWYQTLPAPVVLLITLGVVVGLVIIARPLVRAIARRIEGRAELDPAIQDEIEHLRTRVGDLEALQGRLADLEERVDFAERLLAQQRAPERLPGGVQP